MTRREKRDRKRESVLMLDICPTEGTTLHVIQILARQFISVRWSFSLTPLH
eukprot:34203_6